MSKTKEKKPRQKDPNKLGLGRLLLWKSSDVSAGWATLINLNFLTLYATDSLGLNALTVGTIMLASKIIDGAVDLFYGWLVDNTNTKLGRGRTYELCIVGMTLCTILQFSADPAWGEGFKYGWLFFTYFLTFSVFQSLRGAGGPCYTIRAFSNNETLIRKVSSYGGIVTMAGSLIVSSIFPTIVERIAEQGAGWTAAVSLIMIPATLIGVLRFVFFKEDPSVDAGTSQEKVSFKEIFTLFRRNKYVWLYALIMLAYSVMTNLSVGSYYFKYIVGSTSMMGLLSATSIILLPLMLVFPKIMEKLGSMSKMIAIFCVLSIVGYLVVFISGGNVAGVIGGYILGSLGGLPIAYYGVLFIMDICTYNEMLDMPRMDGSSNILGNFASNFGGSLGSWIGGAMLALGGYVSAVGDELVEQPASALLMIRVDFALVPIACLVVIIVCCLAFMRLEKEIPAFEAKRKAELEAAGVVADEAGEAVEGAEAEAAPAPEPAL